MELKTKTVSFIGLGLIGGSIAKAIKNVYPNIRILAHAGHVETIREAFEAQVIENDTLLRMDELAAADIIFLCGPVDVNIDYAKQLQPFLKPHSILTDVGSVKEPMHKAIKELGLDELFIGGHPMTGSEKIGFSHSSPNLLENAYYILTSEDGAMTERMQYFSDWIKQLGPMVLSLSYEEHDTATAGISHLPHVLSAALVQFVMREDSGDELMKRLAAGGFRDMTRIAASSPVMWQQICFSNKEKILNCIDRYVDVLGDIKARISEENTKATLTFFDQGKEYRDNLSLPPKGLIESVYELFCDLEDKAGGIAAVAGLLAAEDISIKNIGIVHNREFEEGALRIEFYSNEAKNRAISTLTGHYKIFDRT